jgi:hypothetical protein
MEIKVIPHFENVDLLSVYDYKIPEEEEIIHNTENSKTAPCTPVQIPSFTKSNININEFIMK